VIGYLGKFILTGLFGIGKILTEFIFQYKTLFFKGLYYRKAKNETILHSILL
jgi:hypothetical protein